MGTVLTYIFLFLLRTGTIYGHISTEFVKNIFSFQNCRHGRPSVQNAGQDEHFDQARQNRDKVEQIHSRQILELIPLLIRQKCPRANIKMMHFLQSLHAPG